LSLNGFYGDPLAYSEILGDERKKMPAGFWLQAKARFGEFGITAEEVLTDNGGSNLSKHFDHALKALPSLAVGTDEGTPDRFRLISLACRPLLQGLRHGNSRKPCP